MIFKTFTQSLKDVYIAEKKINEINNLKLDATNITSYATALKGLNTKQAELVLSTQGLTVAQKQAVLADIERITSTGELTAAQMTEILVSKGRTEADAKALLIKTGLITSETAETTATNVVTASKLKELIQTEALTKAEVDLIAAKAGVTLASQKESASLLAGIGTKIKGAGTALKGLGTGILTIAQAHPVIAGITAALALCGGAALANKVKQEKAAKAIKEAYEKAKDAIDEINNTYSTNSSQVKEISKEYAELAQGVNLLTNSNKNLSTEKHERFLELSNQLSELYPSLTKNFDENGNAILDLSGDVNTIVGSLDDLIERQRALANREIIKQIPDLFAGYSNNVANYREQVDEAKRAEDEIKDAYELLANTNSRIFYYANGANHKDYQNDDGLHYISEYIKALEALGIEYEEIKLDEQTFSLKIDYSTSTELHDIYVDRFDKAVNDVKYAEQQFEAETSLINKYLNTWLQAEFSYIQIDNTGLQKAIQETLFNFDWSNLPEDIDKNDWDAVSEYLRRNILFSINNIKDSEVSEALSNIYAGSLNSGELLDAISKVQEYFGNDHPISIALQPMVDDTQPLINNVREKLQDEFDDKVGKLTLEELQIAADQIDVSNGVLLSWDELIDKIREVQNLNNTIEHLNTSTISDSVHQMSQQLKPQFDELASAYSSIFTEDGMDLEVVDNDMLESLRKSFADIEEELGVVFDDSQLDVFFDVLTDGTSTVEDVHDAFNDLATAYFYSTDTLEHLNEETAESIKQQLQQMGVVNNEEIINHYLTLAEAEEELIEIQERLAEAQKDLAESSNTAEYESAKGRLNLIYRQIEAFYDEKGATEELRIALFNLQLQEAGLNINDIDSSSAVSEMLNLAEAAGLSAEYIEKLTLLMQLFNQYNAATNYNVKSAIEADIRYVKSQLEYGLEAPQLELNVDFPRGKDSGAGSAGKDAADEYKEKFEQEFSLLKFLLDNGIITEKEYLDQLRVNKCPLS